MLGFDGIRTTRKLAIDKAPAFVPRVGKKSTKTARQVFLEEEHWERLTRIADFQTEAWKKVDPANLSISRNTVIETFLAWAEKVYWDDKGNPEGAEPSEGERSVQLEAYAARLKRQEKKNNTDSK